MMTDFIVIDHHGIDKNDVRFQQDDAHQYTSHARFDLLRQTFDGHLLIEMVMLLGCQEAAI